MQLLLHPESDDSAQLSQVRWRRWNKRWLEPICYNNRKKRAGVLNVCFAFFLQIETEKLLAYLVETEMNKRLVCSTSLYIQVVCSNLRNILAYETWQKEGAYKGKKFNAICHFFGYQARGSLPSKFDCDYAYVSVTATLIIIFWMNIHIIEWKKICQVLGHICYHILAAGLNGYMATVTNLKSPVNKWKCGAAPITVESRHLLF